MNITAAEITAQLQTITAVDLRKLGATMGIKGASKGKKAELVEAIAAIRIAEAEALAAKIAAEQAAAAPVAKAPKKGTCEDCGRKVGKSGHPTLCTACFDYAGWENTHSDEGHELDMVEIEGNDCPVCHPELDPRTAVKPGRSRAGMVIVAKGTEFHKSATFKEAAEIAGWGVTITVTTGTDESGEEIEKHTAIALKGDDTITMVWNGRAYDYPASSAEFAGKARKVRNLKEALRLI